MQLCEKAVLHLNLRVTFIRMRFGCILCQQPGAEANLERILSWFVPGLWEVGLFPCLRQEEMSNLPQCKAAPYVPNQRLLVAVVLFGAAAASLIFKWELSLGKIKSLHSPN